MYHHFDPTLYYLHEGAEESLKAVCLCYAERFCEGESIALTKQTVTITIALTFLHVTLMYRAYINYATMIDTANDVLGGFIFLMLMTNVPLNILYSYCLVTLSSTLSTNQALMFVSILVILLVQFFVLFWHAISLNEEVCRRKLMALVLLRNCIRSQAAYGIPQRHQSQTYWLLFT